eukprot:symbB.v1.2.016413.t1/scaffold1249.1/size128929/7
MGSSSSMARPKTADPEKKTTEATPASTAPPTPPTPAVTAAVTAAPDSPDGPDSPAVDAEVDANAAAAKELVQLATDAMRAMREVSDGSSDVSPVEKSPEFLGELDCVQCESLLFEPTTLEDGSTVCRPCVKKRRLSTPAARAELWGGSAPGLGFGTAANVILTDLLERCPAEQAAAAEARQRGNGLFGEGKYSEACEAYSEAIEYCSSPDIVVLCNRSLARMKLEDTEGALTDAQWAVAKASRCSGPAMLAKAWLRLGQALRSTSSASAAFALALGGADVSDGLQELCAKMSRSELQQVKDWLRDGRCPGIEESLPDVQMDMDKVPNATFDEDWLRSQLECPLCLGLLWEPSSIPCGHTLCRSCLARTLDHAFDTSPSCPMCRADLSGYLAWLNAQAWTKGSKAKLTHGSAQIPVNRQISAIIEKYFPTESRERQKQIAMAEAEAVGMPGEAMNVPIFICSMAMPAVACPLHIFEPRYRLMMRRCIDSGQRQFGMCLFPGAQFGTMLHIQSFKQLPDGRSQIKTIGTRRFQVLDWGEKDGYATGRIRWVEDTNGVSKQDGTEATPMTSAVRLRKAVDSLLKDRSALEEQLGPMPSTDGSDGPSCPAFVFWCMGLADLPPRICYELCFGETFREDAEKRLTTMLEIYEKKIRAKPNEN